MSRRSVEVERIRGAYVADDWQESRNEGHPDVFGKLFKDRHEAENDRPFTLANLAITSQPVRHTAYGQRVYVTYVFLQGTFDALAPLSALLDPM